MRIVIRAISEHARGKGETVEISVVDDVPRAPTGKVQRNRVRALAENE